MDVEEKVLALQASMKLITQALIAASEANGCSMDCVLALMPALATAGLIDKDTEGGALFIKALKAQHTQLHNLNTIIAQLIQDYELDGLEDKLSPSPRPQSDQESGQ
jgi:hypothetical protein